EERRSDRAVPEQGGRACRHRKLHPRLLQSEPAPLRSWLPVAGPLCKDVEHRVSPLNRCFLASALGGQVHPVPRPPLGAAIASPLPLLRRRGVICLSPPRRGGVARSAGVVRFPVPRPPLGAAAAPPLPLLRRRGVICLSPSSSRRGGAK